MTRAFHQIACVSAFAVLALLPAAARAGDDTARFYGTWKTTVSMNGQNVTIVSVHDAGGYKNFVDAPTGQVPAGDGTFHAADGVWTSNAPAPNNGGVYHFLNKDTVVATNAAGQTVTWTRDKSAEAPARKTPGPIDANTAAKKAVGYTPPSERPGNSVAPPDPPPVQPATAASPSAPLSAEDAALSPNVKAGFAALKSGDRVTAWRDFMADGQRGNSDAQAALGSMLFHHMNPPGTGFYKDAEKWLLSSANQGNKHGMDMLAQLYYADAKNMAGGINPGVNHATLSPQGQRLADAKFAQSRQWLEKSADKGDIYAMGNLAILLNAGVGGPRDPKRAAQLIEQVKKGPDKDFAPRITTDPSGKALTAADAMFFLGLMYEHARGVTQDLDNALKLFDQATDLGQGYAKMEAAGMRMQGEINRLTAHAPRGSGEPSYSDQACQSVGGTPIGATCRRDGVNIEPFEPYEPYIAPEPVFEPSEEPEE